MLWESYLVLNGGLLGTLFLCLVTAFDFAALW